MLGRIDKWAILATMQTVYMEELFAWLQIFRQLCVVDKRILLSNQGEPDHNAATPHDVFTTVQISSVYPYNECFPEFIMLKTLSVNLMISKF
ncbi:hypothetical protein AVEN_264787-1 [Araneus ventricosus]|uniref:Uncharacterized protein n=1 Tax=Araneus ventricosus TaxID=182803 RepID=A0A4Y2AJ09_ARAVE|nr:hypothetical protein AVEN_264787-1 [Araneus ventricosus]